MKRLLSLILTMFVVLTFTACNNPAKQDKEVSIKYYAEASDLLPALKNGVETIGLLPEPAATKLVGMASDYAIKIDVQEVYGGDYPQAVMVVKKSVIDADGSFVNAIIAGINENTDWVKANPATAVEKINANVVEGVTPSLQANAITADVINRCNVYFESAVNAKEDVKNYLQNLISIQENSTAIPSDAFFYDGQFLGETENANYTIVMPDGAPALAMASLMNDSTSLNRNVVFKVVSASTIASYVKNADASKLGDVVILPVNAAAKLIGTGDVYQMVGVVTHGNLYVVSNQNITSLADLEDKQIGVIGQGNVPDLTFRALLKGNNIKYKQV